MHGFPSSGQLVDPCHQIHVERADHNDVRLALDFRFWIFDFRSWVDFGLRKADFGYAFWSGVAWDPFGLLAWNVPPLWDGLSTQ